MRPLVFAVAALSVGMPQAQPPASDVTRNPLAANSAAVADGQRVYDQTCQSCHGAAGQGNRGPALATAHFAHGDEDADLFHTIRAGIAGTQMPPFRGLSDQQIWQLVTYIRSVQGTAPWTRR
jgi:mono/diheme cytochrome c family protein